MSYEMIALLMSFLTLPLFVFIDYMLSEWGIASDLYRMFHVWMGPLMVWPCHRYHSSDGSHLCNERSVACRYVYDLHAIGCKMQLELGPSLPAEERNLERGEKIAWKQQPPIPMQCGRMGMGNLFLVIQLN